MFCFGHARDGKGVYVNLKTFQAFCPEHLALDNTRSGGQRAYLHVQWERVLKDEFKHDEDGDSVMAPAGADDAAAGEGGDAAATDAPMAGAGGDAGAGGKAEEETVTKMAIGVEGGFQVEGDKYRWDKHYTLVIAPELAHRVAWPNDELPEVVRTSVTDIIAPKR